MADDLIALGGLGFPFKAFLGCGDIDIPVISSSDDILAILAMLTRRGWRATAVGGREGAVGGFGPS